MATYHILILSLAALTIVAALLLLSYRFHAKQVEVLTNLVSELTEKVMARDYVDYTAAQLPDEPQDEPKSFKDTEGDYHEEIVD